MAKLLTARECLLELIIDRVNRSTDYPEIEGRSRGSVPLKIPN